MQKLTATALSAAATEVLTGDAAQVIRRQNEAIKQLLLEKYEPVAVVGMGLRFPGGSSNPDELADFLREGRSGIRPVPADRWDVPAFAADPQDAEVKGKIRSPMGGYLDRIDLFDAQFFNISPKEAQYTDPQQRLLLETAWEALEHANIDPAPLRHGNGGVYIGAGSVDYALELDSLPYPELDGHLAAGITLFPLSGRISYFLGWRGPCITVDTACASSLTALHHAVFGLRNGECDIALAGGVNALHHPRTSVVFSHANMLAPDGRCKTFDESADGYVRAEGCAVLVLKRLSDAKRDGDTIHALVRGTAIGQDGESAGLSVPNGIAQAAVMNSALAACGLDAADISYVEAHGTGTPLGDPIEMGAISDVFEHSHTKDKPLLVGSAKTNLGHLEPVAGLVGVIKTILQIREGMIFPHLNCETPSSRIPWDRYPVEVPVAERPWAAPTKRGLVNSFGFGGTIAAAVIEQPPAPVRATVTTSVTTSVEPQPDSSAAVFTLSAKNKRSLRGQIERYQAYLKEDPQTSVDEICRTANMGRAHFGLRISGVVRDHSDIAALLERHIAAVDEACVPEPFKATFLFTGQGSQYPGMAAAVYRHFPVVREHIDECDRLFSPLLGRSIAGLLVDPDTGNRDIDQTRFTQPALFTLEYALAQLWMSWGVRPSAVIGHSIGEVTAAAIAGLFSLPDAATLVAARARLMQSISTPGGMVAVSGPAAQIGPLLDGLPTLAVAAINAPDQCVISGADTELAKVVPMLEERGIRAKRLPVSHAFHSPLMTEIFDEFRAVLGEIHFGEPAITLISNLTGKAARRSEIADPEYWIRHIGEPVNFEAGMHALERRGKQLFLEVGPSTALTSLAMQCVTAEDHLWAASLTPKDPAGVTMLRSLSQLYTAGMPIDWAGVHRGRPGTKTALPTYAFDRKRYWLPQPAGRHGATSVATGPLHHPLLGEEITGAGRSQGVREFRARIGAAQPAYLTDHRINGRPVFPGTGYLEILLALQDALHGCTSHAIRDVHINEALFLSEDSLTEVLTRARAEQDGRTSVEIVSRVRGGDATGGQSGAMEPEVMERCHATAVIDPATPPTNVLTQVGRELWQRAADAGEAETILGTDEVYAEFTAVGMEYGPEFRRLTTVGRHSADLAIGTLRGRDTSLTEFLPPAVSDAALHPLVAVANDDGNNYLPVRIGWFRLHRKAKSESLRSVARRYVPDTGGVDMCADLVLSDGEHPVFELHGLGFKRATDGSRRPFFHRQHWLKRSAPAPARQVRRRVLISGATAAQAAALAAQASETGTDVLPARDTDDVRRLLGESGVTDVCWFWRGYGESSSTAELRACCEANYRDLLAVVGALEEARFGQDQRLWLVTERAQWLPDDVPDAGEDLAAATIWGFGRVLLNEYPAYRATLVDLPHVGDEEAYQDSARLLLQEVQAHDGTEFQVAFRNGLRHVRRLLPYDPAAGREDANVAVSISEYGQFSGIEVAPAQDRSPEGDEIQVQVAAAGLNFKDVLNALGMMKQAAEEAGVPYQPQPLGFECAGTVVAVGPAAEFAPGDAVIVNALGVMKRRVTVPSAAAARKPSGVSFAQAAGLGSAFVTAYYALHDLAHIRAGDKVLIHAAAGGVGQAAVQLAKLAGARVYASASPHKWPLLLAQGVAHVMSSRTLDFEAEIASVTGGGGVDIVLNSLNKDYIPAGLRCLSPGGRFVEMGKIGAWSPDRVSALRPDVTYHNFDLSELPQEQVAALNKKILRMVARLIEAGDLAALPTTVYTLEEIEEAFGVLSRGANLGKLVFDMTGQNRPYPAAERGRAGEPVAVRPDRTYLITGGLGAFGLLTANALADLGARHLALMSRGTNPPQDARHLYERLCRRADVAVYHGDVGDPDDMASISARLARAPHPVGGIVHAAGALADAPISAQSWESIDAMFQAKVYGTWLLDRMADDFPELDFIVAHSSAAAVVGGASQSNYAAANAYLDAVIQRRIRRGHHALGFNWGALSQVGMSARLSARHVKALEDEGVRYFSPARAMRALAGALDGPPAQLVAGECDWDRFTAGKPVVDALYRELVRVSGADRDAIDLAGLLEQPEDERGAMIERIVRARAVSVLHLDDIDDVDPGAELGQLGLDSLMGVELKNTLEATFGMPLPTSLAIDYPSARALGAFINSRLTGTTS